MEFTGQTEIVSAAYGTLVIGNSTRRVSAGTLRKFTWGLYTRAGAEVHSRAEILSTGTGEHISIESGVF